MLIPVIDFKKVFGDRRVKVVLVALGSLLGLAGIGVAGYAFWPEPAPKPPPPVETSTAADYVEYAASEDFARLPAQQRVAWVEEHMEKAAAMDDDAFAEAWEKVDRSQLDAMRENMGRVMRERMGRQVNAYHKLPSSQREEFLDERIDEMRRWGRNFSRAFRASRGGPGRRGPGGGRHGAAARRGSGRGGPPGFHGGDRQAMQKRFNGEVERFMVGQSADQRAKSAAYMTAMRRRLMERGVGRMFGR